MPGAPYPELSVSPLHAAFLYPAPPHTSPQRTHCGGCTSGTATTPKTAGTELPHLTWRKAPRGRFAEKQVGVEERSGRKSLAEIHSLFYQEVKCLENRPWVRAGLSLSPATSSSAGVATPRQLQRQQSRKTRPVFAEDTTSLPVPILGRCCRSPPARQGW